MFVQLKNVSGKPLKLKLSVRHAPGSRIEAEEREVVVAADESVNVERTANGFAVAAEDLPEGPAVEDVPLPNG